MKPLEETVRKEPAAPRARAREAARGSGPSEGTGPLPRPGGIFVEEETEAWRAWAAWRAAQGLKKLLPQTSKHAPGKFGWWFATEFPPAVNPAEQTGEHSCQIR